MKQDTLLWVTVGVLGYFLWRQSQSAPVAQSSETPTAALVLPTFREEWAGSDLYRETGSVLPSGSARDLIR